MQIITRLLLRPALALLPVDLAASLLLPPEAALLGAGCFVGGGGFDEAGALDRLSDVLGEDGCFLSDEGGGFKRGDGFLIVSGVV